MLTNWNKEEREHDLEERNITLPDRKNKQHKSEGEGESSARGVQDRKDTLPTESIEDDEGLMVLAEEETHPKVRNNEDLGDKLTGKTCIKNPPKYKTKSEPNTEKDNEINIPINWDEHLKAHREQIEIELSEKEYQKMSTKR